MNADLVRAMPLVARRFFGEPNEALSTDDELRYGNKGSLKVNLTDGLWHDFASGEKGGVLALLKRELRLEGADAFKWLKGIGVEVAGNTQPKQPKPQRKRGPDERTPGALQYWREAKLLRCTLGERYFVEHRKLDIRYLDLGHVLRWHAGSRRVIALMTDPVTAAPCGIHRTFLDADGRKTDRRMLGPAGIIRLDTDDRVTYGLGLVEGIEDGLAIMLTGWRPIWAAGSAGSIAKFPVLNGVDALTIFADADTAGTTAARECAARWRSEGREAAIVAPMVTAHD